MSTFIVNDAERTFHQVSEDVAIQLACGEVITDARERIELMDKGYREIDSPFGIAEPSRGDWQPTRDALEQAPTPRTLMDVADREVLVFAELATVVALEDVSVHARLQRIIELVNVLNTPLP